MTSRQRLVATPVALVALSAGGHLLGGGHAPTGAALTLVTVAACLVAALTSLMRTRRTPLLVAVYAAFQVVAHRIFHAVHGTALVLLAAPGTPGGSPGPHGHPALVHAGHLPTAVGAVHAHAPTAPPLPGGPHGLLPLDAVTAGVGSTPWLMISTHLLAAVALAWVLGPAATQIVQAVRHIVALPDAVPVPRPARVRILLLPTVRAAARDVAVCLTLRGPPRVALL